MSELSRRDVLRRLALVLTASGTLDRIAAREIHPLAPGTGRSLPRTLNEHEYRTLERLTDLIVPVENGAPGALAAGAAAWIDTISSENDQLRTIYKDGIAWLDTTMKQRSGADFLSAAPTDQTALLDLIA